MSARPLVAVFVGTDHHPFDRMVSWATSLAGEGGVRWFVQHGTTRPHPDTAGLLRWAPYVDQAMLQRLLERAHAVVTHGGPGMIMDAHLAGHVPVVVPRDPAHREHVDDHQLRFTERLARRGGVRRAVTESEFRDRLREAITAGPSTVRDRGPDPAMCLRFTELVAATQHRRHVHVGR